jgi:hypothetical protein
MMMVLPSQFMLDHHSIGSVEESRYQVFEDVENDHEGQFSSKVI